MNDPMLFFRGQMHAMFVFCEFALSSGELDANARRVFRDALTKMIDNPTEYAKALGPEYEEGYLATLKSLRDRFNEIH